MSQWKKTNDAANSVNYGSVLVHSGSGKANRAANNTALFNNVTSGAFISNAAFGQFGVEAAALANTSGEAKKIAHPGWVLRHAGEGPIVSVTLTGLSGVTNGETIKVSGGTTNAVLSLVSNATGNVASGTVVSGGQFPNTSVLTFTPNREKHVTTVTVANAVAAITGYSNTDYVVITAANSSQMVTQATANIVTNGSGVFTSANVTVVGTGGSFLQAISNASSNVTIQIYAANGATGGTGTGITGWGVVFANSAGSLASNVAVLGGRAGRVHYETLVAFGSMGTGAGSNTTQLPIT